MPTDPYRSFTTALGRSLPGAVTGPKIVTPTSRLMSGVGFIPAYRLVHTDVTKQLMAGMPSLTERILSGMPPLVKTPPIHSKVPSSATSAAFMAAMRPNLSVLVNRPAVMPTLEVLSAIMKGLKPVWGGTFTGLGTTLLERALPKNLAPLAVSMDLDLLLSVLGNEGIALGTVPRTSLASALLEAFTEQDRRAILGRRFLDVLNDCEQVALQVKTGVLAGTAKHLLDAVATARAGHFAAAQALFASVLDTTLRRALTQQDRAARTSRKLAPTAEAFKVLSMREAVAMLPVWAAYATFNTDAGDLVPHQFNRHATAHSVGRRQYSKRNTAQAALVATSALAYLHSRTV